MAFFPIILWAQEQVDSTLQKTERTVPPIPSECKGKSEIGELQICFNTYAINYVVRNFKYPKESRDKGEQGKVIVSFLVTKNCEVDSVVIVSSSGYERLDEAAIELMEAFVPCEIPAMKEGEPIDIRFSMPVKFGLHTMPEKKKKKKK